MGIKHVAYLIALTVDTTYWGSYTDLIPHISLFCMWQQNQKEINGIFIHFTHYLSSKTLPSILEISTTYRHNLHPTQEQYFSTKKLPFPLPARAELVQMRAQVTKCSISRHSQIAIKFSSCFIKWFWSFWHLVQHILTLRLTFLWHFNRYWSFYCK